MSEIKITLAGSEVKAKFSGSNAWLRNDGADAIYAAKNAGITAGAAGVTSIPTGQSAPVYGANGTVYLLGTGSVMLIGSDYSTNPFKTSAQGGSGADDAARAAINQHAGNADIHVTAAEKAGWNSGNADTVDGLHAASFIGSGVHEYWSQNGGDANTINHDYHQFVFGMLNTPFVYCFLDVRMANAAGFAPNGQQPIIVQTAICYNTSQVAIRQSVDNGNSWADWTMLSDGGNAASVGDYTEEKLAALEARIAALEGGT